jgi:gamma-glutamyl:cysteine ligase YbdK (ATP-grasp superfamily)
VLEEGSFRAARFGIAAELPDEDGRLRPVAEWLDEALALARPHADELGCDGELDHLAAIVESGGGAGRQRAVYEIAGMDALLRALTETTGAGSAAPPAPGGGPLARAAPFAGAAQRAT